MISGNSFLNPFQSSLALAVVLTVLATGGCMNDHTGAPVSAPLTEGGNADGSFLNGPGNGAPNGPHFNLNLIGVPKGKTAPMDNNNGHRIFVNLAGNTKINLREGDFQVLDANGTDGNGASFQLPNPDPDTNGVTEYSVYARALGKPGGWSFARTCATDDAANTFCSSEQLILVRGTGSSKFANVSKYLLFVYADIDGNGTVERIPLFDNRLQGYYWDYDNYGLKLVQLRFYEVSTTVP